jgi:hypothetical protein
MERFELKPYRAGGVQLVMKPTRDGSVIRVLAKTTHPELVHWLGEVQESHYMPLRFEDGYLAHADGMRLALAFGCCLRMGNNRAFLKNFQAGLASLPDEIILYWFTLCFYGYRQQPARAALRTLLTY